MSGPPPPLVAIVGRPNVGKSTLFNRLVGRRQALVEDLPGTTRDRLYGDVEWRGRPFRIVDTGGLEERGEGPFSPLIRRQIEVAITEADAILFIVDGRDGLTAADFEIAGLLRRTETPVVLVANKVDSRRRESAMPEFYELGIGEPFPISAYHGEGIGDLLDETLALLPVRDDQPRADNLRLAIIGRPNVGKSALVNALLGEERVIVSEIPGTTRDVIDTEISFGEHRLTLLDTAGIRRSGKIEPGVERHSVMRARDALARADVALCVMDAGEAATAQDTHIVGMATEAQTGVMLVVNKIDLLSRPPEEGERQLTVEELTPLLRHRLKFVPWAPIVMVSALRRSGLSRLLEQALAVGAQRERRLTTAEVNQVVRKAVSEHAPRSVQGKRLKILYATQTGIRPPTFVLFVNDPALMHFSYERYLENRLRAAFGFDGTAVRLVFRGRAAEQSAARERPAGVSAGATDRV